jgi:5-methylcytosine-specific restriction endonuclease McrA
MSDYETPFERSKRQKRIRRERMTAARTKGTHTPEEWNELKRFFGHRCVRCGRSDMALERDHIIPVYQGGSDGIDNIQPLCAPCNASKGPENFNWAYHRKLNGWWDLENK